MTQETTIGWLKFGSALTIFFGALIAAAAVPVLSGSVQYLADLIFFPLDGLQSVAAQETRLMNAIGGGSVLAGAPLNALGNTSFLLIFCLPLWLASKGS